MSNGQRKMPEPDIFSVFSNWLYAKPVNEGEKRPSLTLKALGNVPRISVKTNVKSDVGSHNGRIDFKTDLASFTVAMNHLERMANGLETEGWNVDYEDDFVAGKKMEKKMKLAVCRLDRDPETRELYISIRAYNRPEINFNFGPSKYHALRKTNGQDLSREEISNAYARAFACDVRDLMKQLLLKKFDKDAKNVAGGGGFTPNQGGGNFGGNGGGNSYNKGGNQGGGYNKPKNDFDSFDDFEDL